MTELAKKLPTSMAIAALGWALVVSLHTGVDATFRILLVTAIAGLGGFYLRDFVNHRAPGGRGR